MDLLNEFQFFCALAVIVLLSVMVLATVIVWPFEPAPGLSDYPLIGFTAEELDRITRPPAAGDPLRRSFARRGLFAIVTALGLLAVMPDAAAQPLLAIVTYGTAGHPLLALIGHVILWGMVCWLSIGVVVWLILKGPANLARDYAASVRTPPVSMMACSVLVNVMVWPVFVLIFVQGLRS